MRAGRTTWLLWVTLGAILPLWVGCPADHIRGYVSNTSGERLPGVAVSIETPRGTDAQTLTNAVGEYALPFAAGKVKLSFLKNGYTSGRLELDLQSGGSREIPEMMLWPLPQEAGIFLYEGTQYRRTTPAEARPLVAQATNVVVFGMTFPIAPEKATAAEPYLLLHKVPGYDVQVAKLCPVQVFASGNAGAVQEVWIARTHAVLLNGPCRRTGTLPATNPLGGAP